MSFFVIPHAERPISECEIGFENVCWTVADAGGDAYMQNADTYMQVLGGVTRCIRWWYKVWAYRCGTGGTCVGVQVVHVWAYTGGSVGKSRPFPAPQPPLPLVNHNWCSRPFQNMTSVCSLGKPLPQPKHLSEKNCLKLSKADCMTTLHFPMQLLIPKSKHRH